MCNKVVNTDPSKIKSIPECYKIQNMCDKAINTCFILFHYVPNIGLKKCVKKLLPQILL